MYEESQIGNVSLRDTKMYKLPFSITLSRVIHQLR